jgi:hypothetical protein
MKQGNQDFEGLLSEANGMRSRKAIIVALSAALVSGSVLGEVTATPGTFKPVDPTASDGTETAAAILGANVDASAADAKGVAFVRDVEWSESLLSFSETMTDNEKAAAIAELEALGIITRADENSV